MICGLDEQTLKADSKLAEFRIQIQKVLISGKKFCWRLVTSGVTQGSILDPILFNTCINNLDDGQSVPTASSLVIKNREECQIH